MPRALLVVDLEATCWERHEHRAEEMETIEIGAVRFLPGGQEGPPERAEFQGFVRPVRHPRLSRFCTELTTITQAEVEAAPAFPEALARFLAWLGDPAEVLFASWGEFDRRQLQRDCVQHGVAYPFGRHWNLKRAVPRRLGRKPAGMGTFLAELGLAAEGTPHRGLDDARNLLRIVQATFGAELHGLLGDEAFEPARRSSPARLSRFLALVLRHRAGDFGLAPDEEGFVPLEELVRVVEAHAWPRVERAELLRFLDDPACGATGRGRFERRGPRVRARYGHARSLAPVAYPAVEPPERLFHGTSPAALAEVRRRGLLPMGRQFVHLATSADEARRVGARHAAGPVLVGVRAREAWRAGVVFHAPDERHFLAREVPVEFLEFPPG